MSVKAISGTDSRKNDRLLPCPFCGGEAEIHPSNAWDTHMTGATYFAWCDKCETRGDYYSTEKEAAEAWNIRVERTCRAVMAASKIASTCSECGTMLANWSMRYCPNCGAKVVG